MKGAPADDRGDERLEVSSPKRVAAGVPGVVHALRHAHDQMGVRRAASTLLKLNQAGGFDCPGCAWPEPGERTRFEFCENGVKAVAEEATERRIGAAFFAAHPVSELAARSDHWLGQQGRLTEPMYLPSGADHYEPIGWDGAFALLAAELNRPDNPDRAVFYTSGRTSNEAAFLYQLFVRAFGTNNLPDCSNMCHESSGVALGETIGIGKGTVTLDDLHAAELILVIGQNPGTNHPRMLSALETAKRNGATIVAVNPLPEAGLFAFSNPQKVRGLLGPATALADHFLQLRVGSDLALFQLLNRSVVLEHDAADRGFIDAHCEGYDELVTHLRALDVETLLEATGLAAADVATVAGLLAGSERIIACWAMGLTQHKAAVATIRELTNLLLVRGAIGKPGAGACPVRGHSNVQGDRTMGIYEKPSAALLDALTGEFGFDPPRHHGYDTVEAIRAMARGDVDVFVGMGGNFVAAAPDTEATIAALGRCRLSAQVSTKLNRSHVRPGASALILPCLGRTERDATGGADQFVTVEDSMSMVHATRGALEPASAHLLSEVAIVCRLAEATLGERHGIAWPAFAADYTTIRQRIERVIPGFDRFEERVNAGGFTLPNPPRDDRRFTTGTGRARLTVNHYEAIDVPPGRLLLQTVRSHDQYNTTIYGLDDRYRGIKQGRKVVFCSAADLRSLGRADGEVVDVVSEWRDGSERRAEAFRIVEYPVAEGTCAAYFPEANILVPLDSTADGSGTPTSKSVVVRLERR